MYAANIGDQFADVLDEVLDIALKVVIFLAIVGLGWFVAKWIHRGLARFLRRVGVDRAAERGGLRRVLGTHSASDLAARLVVLAFLLFVLQLAFGIFGTNPVSNLISDIVSWLPDLFVAVIIVVVTAAIAGWVKDLLSQALGGLSYGRTLATAVQVLIVVLGVTAAINQLGVAVSVTLPVLIAVLATLGGVIIVGVGGGLIRPMQHRWERILIRAETESALAADKIRADRAARAAAAASHEHTVDVGRAPVPSTVPPTDETTTDATAFDATKDNATASDATRDDATRDGATRDGATKDGATKDGASANATPSRGTRTDGTTTDGTSTGWTPTNGTPSSGDARTADADPRDVKLDDDRTGSVNPAGSRRGNADTADLTPVDRDANDTVAFDQPAYPPRPGTSKPSPDDTAVFPTVPPKDPPPR